MHDLSLPLSCISLRISKGMEGLWITLFPFVIGVLLPVSVLSSSHYLVSLASDTCLVHIILSGCQPRCSSWPLPLPTASRRLASALLHATAGHPLMLLTQWPVHPPRALISLESAPPNTGPELFPHHCTACLSHQPVGKHGPFPCSALSVGFPEESCSVPVL